jgi:2-polyprenyl-3-methyl-5-hydroxy-6-metoxy-1,4-benzoquinol methylase
MPRVEFAKEEDGKAGGIQSRVRRFPITTRRFMDSGEYGKLAAVEREHWYYEGKRVAVRHWIDRVRPAKASDRLLDCGAGSGLFAEEMSASCQVLVLDTFEESLRMLRERFAPEQVLTLENDEVPLPAASVHYVTALDVLEHVPDDAAVVRGFARLLVPGGVAVVTVPASMALWSDWDVALHHYRRYDRDRLAALFGAADWEIVHVNYTNVPVFPVVWLVRKLRGLRRARDRHHRPEDVVPWAWLNRLLRFQFVRLAMSRWRMPFGVSLLLVARRRG